MSRLFTFGCSFTKYNWPTWADLLGLQCNLFNWGHPGVGNRAIVERLVEAYCYQLISKNDVVIIQWSHINRHDYARPDIKENDSKMWKTKGNIFSPTNKSVFDNKWINNFWSHEAYFIHTLHNIVLAQELLKSIGCAWFMTSISDIEEIKLDDETKENEKPLKVKNFWELDESLYAYKEKIWNQHHEHWLPPLLPEKWNTPELDWWFDISKEDKLWSSYFNKNENVYQEPHLTSLQNHNYLKNNEIYDLLGYKQSQISQCYDAALGIEEIKSKTGTNQVEFLKEIKKSKYDVSFDGLKGR